MSLPFIAIGVCLLLLGIWSIPPARDYVLMLGVGVLDEWLERWLLPALTLSLCCLFYLVSRHEAVKPGGGLNEPPGSPPVSAAALPVPNTDIQTLPGQVTSRDGQDQPSPVSGATIRVGQSQVLSDDQGLFQVPLYPFPKMDSLVQVSHGSHVTRFLRYDDPIVSAHKQIELTPKMRIIVLEAGDSTILQPDDNRQDIIRSNLEGNLECSEIELLADAALRDDIVQRLYQYQEGRALYDTRTIQKVGDFHGATHGVFWSVKRQVNSLQLECKLVSFKTANIVKSVFVQLENENLLSDASAYLAGLLLAQLAEIKILSPKTGTSCGHGLPVEGYALYKPKTWALWLTLLPEGNHRHYPQLKITVQADGSWFASAVYVGPEERVTRAAPFRIYAVLADPQYTKKFSEYLEHGTDKGIEFDPNDNLHYRILDNIKVTRTDSNEGN